MTEEILIQLTAILVLGIAAQWVASLLRIPAILLLLLAGFIAGPVLGLLHVDALLGDLLFPFVSLSVGIILFEGSLSLKLSELRQVGRAVRNLITVGALITWALSTFFAHVLLGFEMPLALQMGAILVVTGPTVVIPLLRFVRPSPRVGSTLRWEGILIDPVGATLSLLVFQFILIEDQTHALSEALQTLGLTLVVGGLLGYLGGRFLQQILRRYWVPDQLQTAVTLMIVVAVFTLSNLVEHEAGLLATTVMGITLANQKSTPVRHLLEFKENLVVLLLSSLFILLSARLELSQLSSIGLESILFLAAMILIVRPISVLISTLRTPLTWPERLFLMWMAPRGIVAASVASVFALGLTNAGFAQANQLIPATFVVIVGTCTIYGLTSVFVAQRLKLALPNPQGVLIVGAHSLAIAIGQALKELEVRVLLVDTNYNNVSAARMAGLSVVHGNILSESTEEELDLQGIGYLLALTSNDEVNAWVVHRFAHSISRANVYQLASKTSATVAEKSLSSDIHGRTLFSKDADYRTLMQQFRDGATVKATKLTKEFDYKAYLNKHAEQPLPLFAWDGSRLLVESADAVFEPQPGQTVLSLIPQAADQAVAEAS